ncbi:protocadherin Fat 4-like [Glandiceps talaboti]
MNLDNVIVVSFVFTGILLCVQHCGAAPPVFANLDGTGSVSELANAPVTWHLVNATDDDSPLTDITFSISGSDPPDAPFQIGSVIYNFGAVAEIQNAPNPGFDYETQATTPFKLYITATDGGGLVTTATLTMSVFDENEPINITNLPDTVVLPESELGDIYEVKWWDEDLLDPGKPIFSTSTTPSGGPFSIDDSGKIEIIPPGLNYLTENFWTVNVYIKDSGGLVVNEKLYVQVIDVNVGPMITNMPVGVTIQIGEMSSGGNDIFTVEAVDDDEDDYFCVMFVNPNDGNFEMNSTTNIISVIDNPDLDYETLPTYTLTVTCHDSINAGAPRELIVNLIDENEPPELLNLPATVTVPEDAINKAAIFDVEGFDVDGNDLRYYITVTPTNGQGKFFVVNTTAFDARIKIPDNPAFDFEDIGQYTIVVEATDGEFTATGTLNVDIVDTDEPPKFVDRFQDVYIDENKEIGAVLPVNWAVIDVDTQDALLMYNMVSGSYSSYFTFSGGPQLSIAQPIDYDSEINFPVPFVVRFSVEDPDGGKDYMNVRVHIQNINDNSPVFTQTLYAGSVYEMESYGSSILQVSAVDGDLADVVTYSINPVNPYFDIDPVTGDVTVKQLVNRAIVGEFVTFAVVATDNGSPSRQDTSTVTITLIDINDNAPSFSKSFWNWEIRFDADIASYVNSVTATDPDVGQNGFVTTMLYTPNSKFNMETDGRVIVQNRLGPEQKYIVTCYAKDSGTTPEVSDVAMVRIDTFIPQLVLVDVYLGITVAEFTSNRQQQFLDELNTIYNPWYFRISTVRSSTDLQVATKRRLLQDTAVAEIYALTNHDTDNEANVAMTKEFVYYKDLLSAMRIHSDGTPSDIISGAEFDNFPIVKVEPTYDITSDDFNWWLDTVEGNVTIGVLASIIPLALLMCLAAFCCWKYRCCQRCASYCCRRSKRPKTPIKRENKEVKRPNDVPKDVNPPANDGKFDLRYANRPHFKMFDGPAVVPIPTTTAPFGQNVQKKSHEPLIIAPLEPKRNPTVARTMSRQPSRSSNSTSQTELSRQSSTGNEADKESEGTLNIPALNSPGQTDIDEDVTDGSYIYTVVANGQGGNARYSYALQSVTPDSAPFTLIPQGTPSPVNEADIFAVVPPGFNYEVVNQYVLIITVVDLDDLLAGTVTGTLTVDINDAPDPPIFTNLPGVASVGELSTIPATFHSVTVTDEDSNVADITFSISGSDPPGAPFQIGTATDVSGNIASDVELNPGPPKTRQMKLSTRGDILDIDNIETEDETGESTLSIVRAIRADIKTLKYDMRKVTKTVNEIQTKQDELVEENKKMSDRIAELEREAVGLRSHTCRNNLIIRGLKEDRNETWDDCENMVRVMLKTELDIALVEIQNALNPGFDYETQFDEIYELYITATDNTGLTITSNLNVSISDENEPINITNLPDTVMIPESTLGDIYQVEWFDEDIRNPGNPSFMISTAPSGGPFSIDASGMVKVTAPGLDYLTTNFWTVNVYIEDPGGLTDSAELYVQITDVNVGPVIVNMPAGVSLDVGEVSSAGNDIFTVVAVDNDADDYFCVMLVDPNDGNFEINSITNVISVIDSPTLDFETLRNYTLTVTCHDTINAGAPRELFIQLTDENEPPEILDLPATVTVPEDAINMAAIYTAAGFDQDGNDLRYYLSVIPASGLGKFFVINTTANDAKIKVSDNPGFDYESIDQYTIILEATDGEFTATGTLNVDIVDADEPPRFVDDIQNVFIREDQMIGTVLSVDWAVVDVDTPQTSLVYSMVDGSFSSYFTFTNGGPQLSIARLMDYEAGFPEPFTVTFSVEDPEGGKGYMTLKVHLQNVNDNSPVFSQTLYTGSMYEKEPYGSSILQVSAIDDEATAVTYSINPVNPYFDIDPVTGDVTVKQLVDYMTVGEFVTFTVVAIDNGSPSRQVTSTVTINILDINDNAPIFSKSFWNWEIRYDADVASYVNSVTATDPDVGQNGVLSYLLYIPHAKFSMETDGQVFIQERLKPELKYLVTCYARDSGTPPAASGASTIRIDTFIPQFVLVDVYLGISVVEFTSDRQQQFLNELNNIYSPWYFRISTVRSRNDLQVATKRRLLEESAVAEIYALTNDNTEHQANIDTTKDFVYYKDLLSAMRIHSDGTPSDIISGAEFDNYPIVKVEPTYEVTSDDFNWWLDTVEGNVTIGVLASIIPLALLIALIAFCCWKYRCCEGCARCCGSLCKRSKKERAETWERKGAKRPGKVPRDVEPANNGTFDHRYANRPHGKMFDGPGVVPIPTKTNPFGHNLRKKGYQPVIVAPSQPRPRPTTDSNSRPSSRSSNSSSETKLSDGNKSARTYGHAYSSYKTPLKKDFDTHML